ncbi:MAG: hypothetical protein ACK52I_26215 [Pseudomonadota bacterium]
MLLFDEPIVAPPTPQKTYPIVWIRNLQINAHDPNSEGQLYLEIVPMSQDRELLYSGTIELKTAELYRAMQEVPELANAFGAILAAVKPTQAWIDAQNKPEEPTPE